MQERSRAKRKKFNTALFCATTLMLQIMRVGENMLKPCVSNQIVSHNLSQRIIIKNSVVLELLSHENGGHVVPGC